MRVVWLIVFCLTVIVSDVVAGTAGIIEGKVVDKDSHEPLVGVSVSIIGTTMGAATNFEGYFLINNVICCITYL